MALEFEETREIFLTDKRDENAWKTYKKYQSVLNVFEEWFEEADVESLNELNGGDLYKFKQYCRRDRDHNTVSLNGTLAFLTVFIEFCEDVGAVDEGLADDVPVPSVDADEEVSEEMPEDEHMRSTLAYYREFKPGSRTRVELELASMEMLRLGTQRAIDDGDYDSEEQTIRLRHRPEGDVPGTPLKNGTSSNRIINISDPTNEAIKKYKKKRDGVEDDYGRNPLLVTSEGRVTEATIRRDFYKSLRPCETNQGCPHDREKATCEGTKAKTASSCPSTHSPHPIRRWGIVDHLNQGVPIERVSDRADVSVPTLKKHYDPFVEERERKKRKDSLMEHHDAFDTKNESAEAQSTRDETSHRDDSTDITRPVELITQPLQKRLDTPRIVEVFSHDLRAGLDEPDSVVPKKVTNGVVAYGVITATVEVSAVLVGVGGFHG